LSRLEVDVEEAEDGSTASTQQICEDAGSDRECPICFGHFDREIYAGTIYEGADQNIVCTPCEHLFHGSCLERWLAKASTCPMCRSSVTGEQPRDVTRDIVDEYWQVQLFGVESLAARHAEEELARVQEDQLEPIQPYEVDTTGWIVDGKPWDPVWHVDPYWAGLNRWAREQGQLMRERRVLMSRALGWDSSSGSDDDQPESDQDN
jgi:hypothetical protein